MGIQKPEKCRKKAIFYQTIFCILATMVSVIFKSIAQENVTFPQFNFTRNLIGIFIFSFCIKFTNNSFGDVSQSDRWSLLGRTIIGEISFALYAYSLVLVPLTVHMLVLQTNPFWTLVIAALWLKDPISKFDLFAMLVAFSGVICISWHGQWQSELWGISLTFLTSWIFAVTNVWNSRLESVHWAVWMFWHSVGGLVMSILYLGIENQVNPYESHSVQLILLMVLAAILDHVSFSCMVISYQQDSPSFVSLLSNLTVFFAYIADILIFSEQIVGLKLVGALIVLLITVLSACIKLKQSN